MFLNRVSKAVAEYFSVSPGLLQTRKLIIRFIVRSVMLACFTLACMFSGLSPDINPVGDLLPPEAIGTFIVETAAAAQTQTAIAMPVILPSPIQADLPYLPSVPPIFLPTAIPTSFLNKPGPYAKDVTFTEIRLIPNIETIGVLVNGGNLPPFADLLFRADGETEWRIGHPLILVDDKFMAGSLFALAEHTLYEIKVVYDSTEIVGAVSTQPENLQFTPLFILHVDDDALPGGDGSIDAPFQTIQAGINRAVPGTQILVADGTYHEALSFPVSGTDHNWIQIKAKGNNAVLDGSQPIAGNVWKTYRKEQHVWFTDVMVPLKYLARDGQRYYMYDDFKHVQNAEAHDGGWMAEGWHKDEKTTRLYVRSMDHPANHTWQVPQLNNAIEVIDREWIWIDGFEIRYYGTGYGCGICVTNSSHVVIRGNKIHHLQVGIYVNWTSGDPRQGNDARIEFNEIYDPPVNEWRWAAVKGTSMEGTAIVVRGHIGAIVRNNEIHHFNNGIYTGSFASAARENPEVALDVDVYNNHIHHIGDDGLEPEGSCVNHRFRNNVVDGVLVGVSIAPVTQGPTWVLRSLFTNFTGGSIKWDRNSDGIILIYHNTSWTDAEGVNAMEMISPTHNAVMRNNIFQSNGYAFEERFTGSSGHGWDFNNWYSTQSAGFKWENTRYKTITNWCAGAGLECNGHDQPPGFVDAPSGVFSLLSTSPNIDRGMLIPGINDGFKGAAPDIGAYEFGN